MKEEKGSVWEERKRGRQREGVSAAVTWLVNVASVRPCYCDTEFALRFQMQPFCFPLSVTVILFCRSVALASNLAAAKLLGARG